MVEEGFDLLLDMIEIAPTVNGRVANQQNSAT